MQRCSRTLVEMCRHVSPTYTELHLIIITCAGCNSVYVGETCRHISTRVREHLCTDKNSHVYKHLQSYKIYICINKYIYTSIYKYIHIYIYRKSSIESPGGLFIFGYLQGGLFEGELIRRGNLKSFLGCWSYSSSNFSAGKLFLHATHTGNKIFLKDWQMFVN